MEAEFDLRLAVPDAGNPHFGGYSWFCIRCFRWLRTFAWFGRLCVGMVAPVFGKLAVNLQGGALVKNGSMGFPVPEFRGIAGGFSGVCLKRNTVNRWQFGRPLQSRDRLSMQHGTALFPMREFQFGCSP